MKWNYRRAIDFIAHNDEPTLVKATDLPEIASQLSVHTLSEASGKNRIEIANDVLRARTKPAVTWETK